MRKNFYSKEFKQEKLAEEEHVKEACFRQAAYNEKEYQLSCVEISRDTEEEDGKENMDIEAANGCGIFRNYTPRHTSLLDPTVNMLMGLDTSTMGINTSGHPYTSTNSYVNGMEENSTVNPLLKNNCRSYHASPSPPPVPSPGENMSPTPDSANTHPWDWERVKVLWQELWKELTSSADADNTNKQLILSGIHSKEILLELQYVLNHAYVGPIMRYFMRSIDNIVSLPFIYLSKDSDPIALHTAIKYIDNNELSNNIYVIHFVDDRRVVKLQSEIQLVSIENIPSTPTLAQFNSKYVNLFKDKNNDESVDEFHLPEAVRALPVGARRLMQSVSVLDHYYT